MKVLMAVVSDLSTDARVRKQALTLREAGWDVEVIGFGRSPHAAVSVEDGITYRTYYLPASGGRSRVVRLMLIGFSLLKASAAILRSQADVYETHNMHLSLPVILRAHRLRRPVVYDAHELEVPRRKGLAKQLVRRYEAWLWHQVATIITTNPSRASYLQQEYGGPLPTVINNFPSSHPAALTPVPLREWLDIPSDAHLLIFQGGFYLKERDFLTVATALNERPQWHWILVGFGSEATVGQLRSLVADAGISYRTHILPPVPVHELLTYTAACEVGVVPLNRSDLNNYYGDTNKLFEYIVAGLAVVGTNFPEVRRAILDNKIGPVGAVYEPGDVQSFAAALDDVEEKLKAYRAAALGLGNYFSWRAEEQKFLAVFTELASPGLAA